MSSLSSIRDIAKTVDFDNDSHSFVDTMGNLVVNREFEKGFIQFKSGKEEDSRHYIWKVLSAVGDDIEDTLYTNIRNYISKISDVDSCGVRELQSMMNMLGFDYTLFDRFDPYPIEVLNLMNIVTVGKKYMMNSGVLRDALISSLYLECDDDFGHNEAVISGSVTDISTYLENNPIEKEKEQLSALISTDMQIDYRMFNGDSDQIQNISAFEFNNFIRRLYRNLLLDFITTKYGGEHYVINDIMDEYEKIENGLKSEIERSNGYYQRKIELGIEPSFDQDKIADDINDGNDSIDNYQGAKLTLLNQVIQDRTQIYKNGNRQIQNSRYHYYTKRKVDEYTEFILNKYYSVSTQEKNKSVYRNDNNYYVLGDDVKLKLYHKEKAEGRDIDSLSPFELLELGVIDKDIFNQVVDSLVDTSLYIIRLRNKIRLQMRKNYMKGTNNLLLYIINEYLLDYSKNSKISSIVEYFKSNKPNIDNLKVVEYMDQTEYFNLKTDHDEMSISSGSTTNDRFWEGVLDSEPDKISKDNTFALNQIQNFYLNTLNMKMSRDFDGIVDDNRFLVDFLSTLYSCGAVRTSQNADGYINTQLYRDGEWTQDMKWHLDRLSSNYETFNLWLSGGDYEYNVSTTVSAQISDVTENYIFRNLSDEYLSAVSSVYDEFILCANYINTELSNLSQEYNDIISGEMEYYFVKPNKDVYPDCFDSETGIYKHDWYVGNSAWDDGIKYVYDKYQYLQSFCEQSGNVVNHPLIDTAYAISSELESLSTYHADAIVDQITSYGYFDVNAQDFNDEIESTQNFINTKITERTDYLNNLLNSLKEEAQSLRSNYTVAQQQLGSAIESYKTQNGLTAMYIAHFVTTTPTLDYRKATEDQDEWKIDPYEDYVFVSRNKYLYRVDNGTKKQFEGVLNIFDGKYYYDRKYWNFQKSDGTYSFSRPTYVYKGQLCEATELDFRAMTSEDAASLLMDFMNQQTKSEASQAIEIIEIDDQGKEKVTKIGFTEKSAERKYNDNGTNASVNGAIQQVNSVLTGTENLKNTIKDLFNAEESDLTDSGLYNTISKIISYLNDHGFEIFASDKLLKYFRGLLAVIEKIKSDFKVIEGRYQNDILGNAKQSAYLSECNVDQKVTFRNLLKIIKYADTKDAANKDYLLNLIQTKLDVYIQLESFYTSVVDELNTRDIIPSSYSSQGQMLEDEMVSFVDFITNDIQLKIERQQGIIDTIKETVWYHLNIVIEEIQDFLGYEYGFPNAVEDRIDSVYFYDKDDYLKQKQIFLEYGGQNFCYYPYMNHKNIEHPSYQIHPFLWNFVEYDKYTDKLCKEYYNIRIDDFEDSYISSKIGEYVGEFGNVIDEWKHNTLDFSGYTTTYENSGHYENQIFSEVVDFDGSFFPNAVRDIRDRYDMSIRSLSIDVITGIGTKKKMLRQVYNSLSGDFRGYTVGQIRTITEEKISGTTYLLDNFDDHVQQMLCGQIKIDTNEEFVLGLYDCIEETFYGRYYDHLNLTKNDISDEIERIQEYKVRLYDITDEHEKKDVYDIYNYSRDINGNSIILFKQYGKENPTYREKKNTLGQMWVRMKNRPFAFPAFEGKHSMVRMDTFEYCHPTIWRLGKTMPLNEIDLSSGLSSCNYFFDFMCSNDGYAIQMVTYPTDKGKQTIDASTGGYAITEDFNSNETICVDYENSMIVIGYSTTITDSNDNVFLVYYKSEEANLKNEYIRSGYGDSERTHLSSSQITEDTQNYAYIGGYSRGLQNSYHIYALKDYKTTGEVCLCNSIIVHSLKNGVFTSGRSYASDKIVKNQFGSDICFTFDESNNNLTFAYLTQAQERKHPSNGGVFQNENAIDINSYDVFNQNVRMVKTNNIGNQLTQPFGDNYGQCELNINADMSYIPAYPMERSDIRQQKLLTTYRNVELLGKSKDISERIQQVNEDVNPYLTYDDISKNYQFGRVYEDFQNTDKMLRIYGNPKLNYQNDYVALKNCLIWTETLCDQYTERDIRNLNLVSYNVNSFGKTTYLTTKLNKLIGNETFVSYDSRFADESKLDGLSADVTLNGLTLQDGRDFASNRIYGISSISFEVLSGDNGLSSCMRFYLDDTEKPKQFTYIRENEIQNIIFNTNDLTLFERYHLFDTYGFVYALSASQLIATEYKYGDGWVIVKNPKDENFHDRLIQFYDDKYGVRRELSTFQISNYNDLSDVWLMKTNHRLQFKYSEEDYFELSSPLYYMPGLNCRYPKSCGDYVRDCISFQTKNNENTMSACFTDNDLFILDIIDQNEMKKRIGTVEIPIAQYESDDRRVFEIYLSTDFIDGRIIENKDKCDVEDEDMMYNYGFYHCFEEGTDTSEDELIVKGSENYVSQIQSRFISVDFDKVTTDISEYLRIFVNYRKTQNQTIEMFFNYFNYINSPFVEIREDGKTYSLLQEGSYLRLDADEDGTLDIFVQLKYFNGGTLFGTKMLKLASYHIYNVSDDKPKMMIDKVYSIEKNSQSQETESHVAIKVNDLTIDMREKSESDYGRGNLKLEIETTKSLTYPMYFYLEYPTALIDSEQMTETKNTYQYQREGTRLRFDIFSETSILEVGMITTQTKEKSREYFDQPFPCYVDDDSGINAHKITLTDGTVTLRG